MTADGRVTSRFNADSTALEVIAGVDLTGANAIVTGGASGIGVETARALAKAGANVLIAARNLEMGREVADAINKEIGAQRVTVDYMDLGDLESIRTLAKNWGDRPLKILINNAGVMACPQGYTKDGFETQFGCNHLGHFLLTVLLTPALEKGAPSRVVSVSSSAHGYGDIDFDDPNWRTRPYHPFKAYGQSKTANALFAVEYDRRYKDRGVRAYSLMPGVIATRLLRHMTPDLMSELGVSDKKTEDKNVRELKYKNAEQGAATSIWAAVGRELDGKGGLYLENCNQAVPYGPDVPRGEGVMPFALNPESARRLWEMSEKLVGL